MLVQEIELKLQCSTKGRKSKRKDCGSSYWKFISIFNTTHKKHFLTQFRNKNEKYAFLTFTTILSVTGAFLSNYRMLQCVMFVKPISHSYSIVNLSYITYDESTSPGDECYLHLSLLICLLSRLESKHFVICNSKIFSPCEECVLLCRTLIREAKMTAT